jgi:hypothetical protein
LWTISSTEQHCSPSLKCQLFIHNTPTRTHGFSFTWIMVVNSHSLRCAMAFTWHSDPARTPMAFTCEVALRPARTLSRPSPLMPTAPHAHRPSCQLVSWSVHSCCCCILACSCRCTIRRARSAELARASAATARASAAKPPPLESEVATVSRDTSHRWRRLRLPSPPR